MRGNIRYILPNLVTASSLSLGLASVVFAIDGDFHWAAWLIVWGTVLDKLDGTVARLLRACSRFGGELDSFADFVMFGIAPAALVFFRVRGLATWQGSQFSLLLALCAIYIIGVAVRLARFNIVVHPPTERSFRGAPSTIVGGQIALFILVCDTRGLDLFWVAATPYLLLLGVALMVSNLRMPKLVKRKHWTLNAIQLVAAPLMIVLILARAYPQIILVVALSWLVVGMAWCAIVREASQTTEEEKLPSDQEAGG